MRVNRINFFTNIIFLYFLSFFISGCASNYTENTALADNSNNISSNKTKTNIQKDDDRYKMFIAANLRANGEFLEAAKIYQSLFDSTKDYYFFKQVVLCHSEAGDSETALSLAKQYQASSKDLDDSDINMIIADGHLRNGEYSLAIILLEKIVQTNPSLQIHYILSGLYMRDNDTDKALPHLIAVYNDEMSYGSKVRLEALNKIVSIYLDKQKTKEALEYLNKYISSNEYEINIESFIALYAKTNNMDMLKENLYKRYSESQNLENARMYAGILVEMKKYNEAIEFLKENEVLLDNDGIEMLMYVYAENKQFNEAAYTARNLYESTKSIEFLGLSAMYEYETLTSKNAKTLRPIIDTLKTVIEQRIKDLKKEDKKPGKEEAFFYNFLGYILIDHDIDLNAGLQYVSVAVSIEPNSAEYLDSLGWGFYKSGNCQRAKETFNLIPNTQLESIEELKQHNEIIKQCK